MVPRKGNGPSGDRGKLQDRRIAAKDKTGLKDRWY